jgi:hypothetical protein
MKFKFKFFFSHVPQFCDAICSMSFESLGLEQPSDVPMVRILFHSEKPNPSFIGCLIS